MSIRAITKYAASDGSEFDSMPDALAHDAKVKALRSLRGAFQKANVNGTIAMWDNDFVRNPAALMALRDACNSALTYHRNHGKLKKAKTD